MKLKKIASLALAGVMAVSMLAGCGTNGTNNNTTPDEGETAPSSSYTETVLDATNAATQTKLTASTNDKLDKAVAWAAQMDRAADLGTTTPFLTQITDSNWDIVNLAEEYMQGNNLAAYTNDDSWDFTPTQIWAQASPTTWWTLYYVSATASDEYITNEIAANLDDWAKDMANKGEEVVNNGVARTYDYTVSVSKAKCAGADLAGASDDYVIVGVAVTASYSAVNY